MSSIQMVIDEKNELARRLGLVEQDRDNVTEMLSRLMALLTERDKGEQGPLSFGARIDYYIKDVSGLNVWWVQRVLDLQQETDNKRNQALDKLTEEEARLLGVLAVWNERQDDLHMED